MVGSASSTCGSSPASHNHDNPIRTCYDDDSSHAGAGNDCDYADRNSPCAAAVDQSEADANCSTAGSRAAASQADSDHASGDVAAQQVGDHDYCAESVEHAADDVSFQEGDA